MPAWAQLQRRLEPDRLLHRLARQAERIRVDPGSAARLARAFEIRPRGLPVAALTRELEAGDALGFTWLRADPGSLRPDMASARLLACGADLGLSQTEAEALLQPLKPLFGDEGFPISATTPGHWYVCLPTEARLPVFAPPEAVHGDDLFAHLPEGPEARRWRRLMNEAQIILHNHPVNLDRARAGKLPVNTLWFWGGGRLPEHVRTVFTKVYSGDVLIHALAQRAGVGILPLPDGGDRESGATRAAEPGPQARDESTPSRIDPRDCTLLDLRSLADPAALEATALAAILRDWRAMLELDFGDGLLLRWRRSHRWRFWRRRLPD